MEDAATKKLPQFSSMEEAVRFGEETDLGEYLDGMPEGQFEVRLKKRVSIEPDLYQRLDQVAHETGRRAEELIDIWLRERLKAEVPKTPEPAHR